MTDTNGSGAVLAALQARMSSTRLPGKVLRPILGRPMLGRQIDRLRKSRRIGRLVVATSDQASDDLIAVFCEAEGVACHRGSLHDVLGRVYGACEAFAPVSHVVRLTADCPLADWTVIDDCIALHLASGADYTSNALVRTYPDGLDVEVATFAALGRAWREAKAPGEREHVTPYINRRPDVFRLQHLTQEPDLGALRWTVDTPDDFETAEKIFAALLPSKPDFMQSDILELLKARPELSRFNPA